MKVILLKDIVNVGKKYDVKDVSPGHAQNFLFPQKLALLASAKSLRELEQKKITAEAERKIQENLLIKNIVALEGERLTIKERANEKGHLFAGIHQAEIAKALKQETELDVLPEWIILETPIKELGEFDVKVSAHGESASFKLFVEAQN